MKLLIAIAAATLVVGACGDDSPAATAAGTRQIELTATEFGFTPDLVSVSAGETVEFVITNNGSIAHEFEVTNQAEIDEHLEGGHADHTTGSDTTMGDMGSETTMAGMDMPEDGKITIEPGATGTLTVTFAADTTLLTNFVCLLPGHYEAGMVGSISYSS